MSDPQAISSHDPIESTAGNLELVVQAAQRGATDARMAAARTWTATGLFVSRFVYNTCYIISYGVVFPSVSAGPGGPGEQRGGPRSHRRRPGRAAEGR